MSPSVIVPLPLSAKVNARIRTRSTTPLKLLFLADRQLDRHDLTRAVAMQRFERALQAGPFAIEPAEHHDSRQVGGGRVRPQLLGLHFDAVHRVHHHHGGLDHAQRRARVGEEVGHPGGVDEVDLGFEPLGVRQARGQGMLADDGFVVEVGDRGAVVHLSQPVDGAGSEQHGRDQLCLAAPAVPDDGHVSDGAGVVDLHRGIPPGPPSWAGASAGRSRRPVPCQSGARTPVPTGVRRIIIAVGGGCKTVSRTSARHGSPALNLP